MSVISRMVKKLLPPIEESNPRWDEVLQIIQDMGGEKDFIKAGQIHRTVKKRTGNRYYDDFGDFICYSPKLREDLWDMMSGGYLNKAVGNNTYKIHTWGRIRLRKLQEQKQEVGHDR